MKTGTQIVAKLDGAYWCAKQIMFARENWPTIKAALLAYEPKSALRTILESHVIEMNFSANEIDSARAELDALEGK